MKDTIYIIIFGLFIYFGFATVFGDSALMGSYGASFASYNHHYFGYISYIYIFAFIIPLYIFYKESELDIRKLELLIASFLAFFSSLIAQAMVVQNELRGEVGAGFVDFLSPFIGTFGLWTFWFIITLVSLVILIDKNAHEIVDPFLKKIKDLFSKKPIFTLKEIKVESYDIDMTLNKTDVKNNKIDFKEKKEPLFIKEDPKEMQDEYETPSYLKKDLHIKKEEPKKNEPLKKTAQHNILELVNEIKEQKNAIVVDELEENTKLLASIEKGAVEKPKNFTLPSVDFLQKPNAKAHSVDESELDGKIKFLIEKLAHFKIEGDVVRTYAGPVVSTFEFKPAANVKVSRILNLQDDLAMALSAETIRIQAPIPGKDVVGIEIPNEKIDTIYLRELLDSAIFKESSSPLTIVLGKDIVGKPFITDLKKLPHLLIAGTTGSGKSVGINAMILSLLYKNSPDQLRLLMIDPKMLEFSIYNDIPHLLTPVITKAKQAIVALNNMVYEMERRYSLMSENRTKNIESYNEKVKKEGGEHLPYIVVIIDELADLMMTSGKDVEY